MRKVLLTVKIWAFWLEIIMHGANYRDGKGQVFTRKEYIKGKPQIKIAKFQGGKRGTYQYCVQLLLNEKIQIRHMAIESTRLAANKTLETYGYRVNKISSKQNTRKNNWRIRLLFKT
jgi:ribosomal protein L16/L10AE